ncbi:MAG: DUF1189 family protein [Verrucomicrobiota bacterium]|nr:DUF1189 family protein [Verrucomicrobiota bacterium]
MNFLTDFVNLCTNFKFYSQIVDWSKGKVLLRLIQFLTILILLNMIAFFVMTSGAIPKAVKWVTTHLPEMELVEGKLKSKMELPIYRKTPLNLGPYTNLTVGVISTLGQTNIPTESRSPLEIYLLPDKAMVVVTEATGERLVNSTDFDKKMTQKIDDRFLYSIFTLYRLIFVVAIGLFTLFSFILAALFQSIFFVSMVTMMEKITSSPLRFPHILKTSLVCMVPAFTVTLIFGWLGVLSYKFTPFVYMTTYSIYFIAGITFVRRRLVFEWLTGEKGK